MINHFLTIAKNYPSKIFLNYKNKEYSYEDIQIHIIHTVRVINQNNLKKMLYLLFHQALLDSGMSQYYLLIGN